MKTYTHKNGITYNVVTSKGILNLTHESPYIAPMQITEENFAKLNPAKEIITIKVLDARNKKFLGLEVNLTVNDTLKYNGVSPHTTYRGITQAKGIDYTFYADKYDDQPDLKSVRLVRCDSKTGAPTWFDKVETI